MLLICPAYSKAVIQCQYKLVNEVLYLNRTLFDEFAEAIGALYECQRAGYAASVFLKWPTLSAQNMRFIASTGFSCYRLNEGEWEVDLYDLKS